MWNTEPRVVRIHKLDTLTLMYAHLWVAVSPQRGRGSSYGSGDSPSGRFAPGGAEGPREGLPPAWKVDGEPRRRRQDSVLGEVESDPGAEVRGPVGLGTNKGPVLWDIKCEQRGGRERHREGTGTYLSNDRVLMRRPWSS